MAFLILAAAVVDVFSTNVGVVGLGNREASPIASAFIAEFGTSWWFIYLPYEATVLLLSFFVIAAVRRRTQKKLSSLEGYDGTGQKRVYRVSTALFGVPFEYAVPIVAYFTVLNNIVLVLTKLVGA